MGPVPASLRFDMTPACARRYNRITMIRSRLRIVLPTVLLLAGTCLAQPADKGVSEETVKAAIAKAVAYLYSAANTEGVWDQPKEPDFRKILAGSIGGDDSLLLCNWPGQSALVLNALAAAGEQQDPRFKKALAWVMKPDMFGTYGIGMRMELVHRLRDSKPYKDVLKKDGALLLRSLRQGKEGVMWQYAPPPTKTFYSHIGDFSNTNYGVLGLWAACDERLEVPAGVWKGLEGTYISGQLEDGGWGYYHRIDAADRFAKSSASMTTAGIASLYLILDQIHAGEGGLGGFRKLPAYKSIQGGIAWMGKNFSAVTNPGWEEFASYYFYNCERVATAAGMKYFGTHDWFREIAATLLAKQGADGSISFRLNPLYGGVPCDTSFSLLFLSKGSAPVIFNKLQHAGDWDNRLRDLGVLAEWLGRESERPANWQTVGLDAPAEDLTDSRILYIAGTKPLTFKPEEMAKLKRYVELGGTLVFQADSGSLNFETSAAKLLSELWPRLEVTDVKWDSHPLGNIYEPIKVSPYHVRQLASPTRVFAFILRGEPAASWERRLYSTASPAFALGANLHYYANDLAALKDMPTKLTLFGEPFRAAPPPAARTITLARIKYGENPHVWDPEPLAFERFSRVLAAREKVSLQIKTITPGELAQSGARIAHLTGTAALSWTKEDWAPLRAWLAGGGTLLVDQAGGPDLGKNAFDESFRKLLAEEYGRDALTALPADGPLLKGLDKVLYRHLGGVRRSSERPSLECVQIDDRPAILYSRYDLTCGLLGCPNPLIVGLEESGAYQILSRLILGPPAATTAPATATTPAATGLAPAATTEPAASTAPATTLPAATTEPAPSTEPATQAAQQ